jgi:hypothetical protein
MNFIPEGKTCSQKMYSYHNKNEHFTLDDLLTFVKQELEFKNSVQNR